MTDLKAQYRREQISILLWQIGIGVTILGFWEIGSGLLFDPNWWSRPSAVLLIIIELFVSGEIWQHIFVTLFAMALGLSIGVPLGSIAGLIYGGFPRVEVLLNPIVLAIYSIPLVALSPLFVVWFGLGIASKGALVAVVAFWLMFFNMSASMRLIDRSFVLAMKTMGANRKQIWILVIIPSVISWFFSGLRLAIPFALVGAVIGEMIASSEGLGYLTMKAARFIRMDLLFAAIIILIIFGIFLNFICDWSEKKLQSWKKYS